MEQNDSLAIRLRGLNVHVRHRQGLSLGLEVEPLHGMRILEVPEERVGVGERYRTVREQKK